MAGKSSAGGFGDFASTMLAVGRGNRFEVLDRVLFPHSLGIFYTALTQWLGFPKYGDEGKVMGLAPYGDPEAQLGRMRDLVRLDGDLFQLGLDYFTHDKEGVDMTWDEQTPTIGRIFSDRIIDRWRQGSSRVLLEVEPAAIDAVLAALSKSRRKIERLDIEHEGDKRRLIFQLDRVNPDLLARLSEVSGVTDVGWER